MNKTVNNKKDNTKKTKRRAYESLLLLLLTISLFITATFAWFTDSAFSKGNKVFAGNLYIDTLADADELEGKYLTDPYFLDWKVENETKDISDYLVEELGCEPYSRTYPNPDFDSTQEISETNPEYIEEEYYITTGTEAGGVNLYNMEPGQVRKLDIKYVNTGDLAFKAGGALKLDYDETTGEPKSYTGLETLKQQYEQEVEIYRNEYAVSQDDGGNDIIDSKSIMIANNDDITENDYYSIEYGFESYLEFNYRKNKLLLLQSELDENGAPRNYSNQVKFSNEEPENPIVFESGAEKYNDLGGHLEEILEVYVIPSADKDNNVAPSSNIDEGGTLPQVLPVIDDQNKKDSISTIDHEIFTNKDNELHKEYYFGNLEQFTFLMDNGAIADKDYDYERYALDDSDDDSLITLDELKEKSKDSLSNEEKYMLLYDSIEASLYDDYQRYLTNVGGYCLPKDAVTKDGAVTLPSKDGVKVKIYDKDGDVTYQTYSEMGECEIYLYMPTTADSRYQNASISLSIGATATQVEYEMDDTGYMLYDKFGVKNENNKKELQKGNLITVEGSNKNFSFKVLDVVDDVATCLYISNNSDYFAEEGTDPQSFGNGGDPQLFTKGGSKDYGILYEGSLYQDAIDSYLNDIQNNNPSLYNSIVETNFAQHLYKNIFEDSLLLNANGSLDDIYYKRIMPRRQEVAHYHMQLKASTAEQNMLARPLSLIDVVNYTGKGTSSEPIEEDDIIDFIDGLGLNKNNQLSIWLSDAEYYEYEGSYDISEQDYMFVITNEEPRSLGGEVSLTDFHFDTNEYCDFEALYPMIIDFDTKKFNNYDIVDPGDIPSDDDNIIKIGIASNISDPNNVFAANTDFPIDPCYYFLNEAIKKKGLSNKYSIELKYMPSNQLRNFNNTQYTKIQELIQDDIDYLIVESIDNEIEVTTTNEHINDITEICDRNGVYLFLVGNDTIGKFDASPSLKYKNYLATSLDYAKAIESILLTEDYGSDDDVNLASIYSSGFGLLINGLLEDVGYFTSQSVSGFNYDNVYSASSSNYDSKNVFFSNYDEGEYGNSNYTKAVVTTKFNELSNIFDFLHDDYKANFWYDESNPVLIYCYDHIYIDDGSSELIAKNPTDLDRYGYYGIFYDYDTVCAHIMNNIIQNESSGSAVPPLASCLNFRLNKIEW